MGFGSKDEKVNELAMLWVLNLSDGDHTLLDIADRSGLEFGLIKELSDKVKELNYYIHNKILFQFIQVFRLFRNKEIRV